MKTIQNLAIVILIILSSCQAGKKTKSQKISFGIFETVPAEEIPDSLIESLKIPDIQIEKNTQSPIIGYVRNRMQSMDQGVYSKSNFKLVKMMMPVDKKRLFYAVVAIKPIPAIVNSDIKRTKNNGNTVEIFFNFAGSKKWAELTKINIGNRLAFVIDNDLYSLPLINGEIRNGMALIGGLENKLTAKELSDELNASLHK